MFKLIIPYRAGDNPHAEFVTFNTRAGALKAQELLKGWDFKSFIIDDHSNLEQAEEQAKKR